LLGGGLGQLAAPVPGLDDEEAGQPVEVALAVDVVDVGALTADDGGNLGVLVGAVPGEVHPQVVLGCLQHVVGRLRHLLSSSGRSAPQCATSPGTLPRITLPLQCAAYGSADLFVNDYEIRMQSCAGVTPFHTV